MGLVTRITRSIANIACSLYIIMRYFLWNDIFTNFVDISALQKCNYECDTV